MSKVSRFATSIIFGEHLKASFSDIFFEIVLFSEVARLAACDAFLAAARNRFTVLTAMAPLRILIRGAEVTEVGCPIPPGDGAARFDIFRENNSI